MRTVISWFISLGLSGSLFLSAAQKAPPYQEELLHTLDNPDIPSLIRTIQRLDDSLPAWRSRPEGIRLKQRLFDCLENSEEKMYNQVYALRLLIGMMKDQSAKDQMWLITFLQGAQLPLMDGYRRWFKTSGCIHYFKEMNIRLDLSVRRELLFLTKRRFMTLSWMTLHCLETWDDDPVINSMARLLLTALEKLSWKEMSFLVTAMEKNQYDGALAKLIGLYLDGDEDIRDHVVIALGHLRLLDARMFLEKCRRDDDRRIRALAEWALYRLDDQKTDQPGR